MASIVEYNILKPNWVLLIRLFDNKYSLICLYSRFSKNLESATVMEIGLSFLAISGSSFLYIGVIIAFLSLVGKIYIVVDNFIYRKHKVWIYFIASIFQSPGWKIRRFGCFI